MCLRDKTKDEMIKVVKQSSFNNGPATLPIYEPNINWLLLFETMQAKINPETSKISSNLWEYETISVLLMSNGRMGLLKHQSIR